MVSSQRDEGDCQRTSPVVRPLVRRKYGQLGKSSAAVCGLAPRVTAGLSHSLLVLWVAYTRCRMSLFQPANSLASLAFPRATAAGDSQHLDRELCMPERVVRTDVDCCAGAAKPEADAVRGSPADPGATALQLGSEHRTGRQKQPSKLQCPPEWWLRDVSEVFVGVHPERRGCALSINLPVLALRQNLSQSLKNSHIRSCRLRI